MPSSQTLFGLVVAFAAGILGALIFRMLDMPLPWLLGSMTGCLMASMTGAKLQRPSTIEPYMRAVLGLMAGSYFTPDIVNQVPLYLTSLAFLIPYTVLSGLLGLWYLQRSCGYDVPTAFFAAMPGGLADMCAFGKMYGGDERQLVLVHTTRVFVLVFAMPFIIEWMEGIHLGANAKFGGSIQDFSAKDASILLTCAVVGWWAAAKLKIAGPIMVGPMIASALIHSLGWTDARLPDELIKMSQLILGVGLGSAFAGVAVRGILSTIGRTIILMVMLLIISLAVTFLIVELAGLSFTSVLLAYTPGGQAEMALIAITIGDNVSYIVVHHILRVLFVVLAAPIFFKMLGYVGKPGAGSANEKSDSS